MHRDKTGVGPRPTSGQLALSERRHFPLRVTGGRAEQALLSHRSGPQRRADAASQRRPSGPLEELGYARVSTAKQDLDRQVDALTQAGIAPEQDLPGQEVRRHHRPARAAGGPRLRPQRRRDRCAHPGSARPDRPRHPQPHPRARGARRGDPQPRRPDQGRLKQPRRPDGAAGRRAARPVRPDGTDLHAGTGRACPLRRNSQGPPDRPAHPGRPGQARLRRVPARRRAHRRRRSSPKPGSPEPAHTGTCHHDPHCSSPPPRRLARPSRWRRTRRPPVRRRAVACLALWRSRPPTRSWRPSTGPAGTGRRTRFAGGRPAACANVGCGEPVCASRSSPPRPFRAAARSTGTPQRSSRQRTSRSLASPMHRPQVPDRPLGDWARLCAPGRVRRAARGSAAVDPLVEVGRDQPPAGDRAGCPQAGAGPGRGPDAGASGGPRVLLDRQGVRSLGRSPVVELGQR